MTDVGGTKGVSRVQSVPDGALLTFEDREWADDPSKGSISRGHYGSCSVYLKKVDSAINDKGAGDGWFKIFDHGYDASTSRWCTDEIIDNKGLLSVNLPKGLEGGYYLARPEILALHNALPSKNDPQFYTGCAQIFLESSGNLGPESTVSIPGYVKYGEPSTSWDIYSQDNSKYPVPGPAVAKLVAKADSASIASTQTEGAKPDDCILENANWCGKEVASYSDETGCWASSKTCWDQSKACWDAAPPTGGANCKIWENKCTSIDDACNAKSFNGPPNKGKVLTPEKKAIDVGKIMATEGGGIVDSPTPKTSATQKVESKTDSQVVSTPAAENEYDDSTPEVPAQSPAQTTSAAASQAPKPSSAAPQAAKPTVDTSYPVQQQKGEAPVQQPSSTITVPASAPKPTKGPACVPGGKCVTVTELEVVTQTVYVTLASDGYKRGMESFKARRRRAHHRA